MKSSTYNSKAPAILNILKLLGFFQKPSETLVTMSEMTTNILAVRVLSTKRGRVL